MATYVTIEYSPGCACFSLFVCSFAAFAVFYRKVFTNYWASVAVIILFYTECVTINKTWMHQSDLFLSIPQLGPSASTAHTSTLLFPKFRMQCINHCVKLIGMILIKGNMRPEIVVVLKLSQQCLNECAVTDGKIGFYSETDKDLMWIITSWPMLNPLNQVRHIRSVH